MKAMSGQRAQRRMIRLLPCASVEERSVPARSGTGSRILSAFVEKNKSARGRSSLLRQLVVGEAACFASWPGRDRLFRLWGHASRPAYNGGMEQTFAAELARFGPESRPWPMSLAQARAYCARLTHSHYENFTV